jgi:DNA invertase Pin-like site-specific DNA recombinase
MVTEGWDEGAGNNCLWVWNITVDIDPSPFVLGDGKVLYPGSRLRHLGGSKTSAGYPRITMLDGHYLEYVGQIGPDDRRIILFRDTEKTGPHPAFLQLQRGKSDLFFYTRSNAGRVVHTTACEWHPDVEERTTMTAIGYTRISTPGQDMALQVDALTAAGVVKFFQDVGTGRKLSRPGLTDALAYCRPGDTLTVWRLDRLARSLQDLVQIVAKLTDAGVHLKSLHEQIDTSSANGRFMLHIFAALAEFEVSLLSERTHAGLKAAKDQGRTGGRRPKMTLQDVQKAVKLLKQNLGHVEVARRLKVSRTTLYRGLRRGAPQLDTEQQDLLRDVLKSAKG